MSIKIEQIEIIVCAGEDLNPVQIHVKKRNAKIKEARQIIMYFAKEKTSMTLADIGAYFYLDHATAHHAHKTIGNLISVDSLFRKKIKKYDSDIDKIRDKMELNTVGLVYSSLLREAEALKQKVMGLQLILSNMNESIEELNKINMES